MSTLLSVLLLALLILVLWISSTLLAQVRQLRLVEPAFTALSPLEVPEGARQTLAPGLELLQSLGFAQPTARRMVAHRRAGRPVDQYLLVLTHQQMPAAAFLHTNALATAQRPWGLYFVSQTQKGQFLLTRNHASVTGPLPLPEVRTHDVWLPDGRAVWRAHRSAMRRLAPRAWLWSSLNSEAWARAGEQVERASFLARLSRRQLVPAGEAGEAGEAPGAGVGSYRVSWGWALSILIRAWAGAHRGWRPSAVRSSTAGQAMPQDAAQRASLYEEQKRPGRGSVWSSGAKWLLFFASACLAALSFGLSMDLQTLAALLLVLLVHEGGHYLAMRWAGYQDLKVFFLPFLGAAVSGRHEQPTLRQELTVLFAGPLPGLLLGLAGLLLVPAGTLGGFGHACALLAVILNAFNLLPIHPLDGGKIFEVLLLGRWPGLAFTGRLLGLLILGAVAFATSEEVARAVLLALVLLMALGLPQHWREARVARALRARRQGAGLSRPAALQALFSAITEQGYGRLAWPSQKLLVEALLPSMLRPRLSRGVRLMGLGFYAFCLALPLLALLAWASPGLPIWPGQASLKETSAAAQAEFEAAGRSQHAQWLASRQAELQALQQRCADRPDTQAQWSLLVDELGQAALDMAQHGTDALPAAEALLRTAESLAATPGAPPAWRAQAALWRADAETDPARRLQHLRLALSSYDTGPSQLPGAAAAASASSRPDAQAADLGPLLRAAQAWASEAPADAQPSPAAEVERVLALAAPVARPQDLLPLQRQKVDLLLAAGQRDAALALAKAVFDRESQRGDPSLLAEAANLLVDTSLATDGPTAALQALDGALTQLEQASGTGDLLADSLRHFGLWLAEAAHRPDWQQAQVEKLMPMPNGWETQSWTDRALMWLFTRGQAGGPTLVDVERAHWAGQPEAARRAAQRLLERMPRFVVRLWPGDERSALAKARNALGNEVRSATYRRYGIPVRFGDAGQ